MPELRSLLPALVFPARALAVFGVAFQASACGSARSPAPGPDSGTHCVYDGRSYMQGETFTDSAGCNQCVCQEDGQVACDTRYCEDEVCTQPFEVGACFASIRVFWHNPELGVCEPKIYGGCGGNDNRFESRAECEAACSVTQAARASCLVEGTTYAHGETVPDPFSCNSCECDDGQVTSCTEIGCAETCGDRTIEASACAECGPAGGCAVVETGCLPLCEADADCSDASRPRCDQRGYCVGASVCF